MSNNHYYANADARLNTILDDERLAKMLKRSYIEYENLNDIDNNNDFLTWLIENYGISVHQTEFGYKLPFVIVDQKKYTLFTLKFS